MEKLWPLDCRKELSFRFWVSKMFGHSPLADLLLRLSVKGGISRSPGGPEPVHSSPHWPVMSKLCREAHGPEWPRRPYVGYSLWDL